MRCDVWIDHLAAIALTEKNARLMQTLKRLLLKPPVDIA
jgi:hypothetical protein